MSAYGKPQPSQFHGFDAGRSYPEGSYAYTAPIYGQPSANQPAISPAFQDASPMTQMAYPTSQSRETYDEQAGPYLNVGSSPIPEVKSFNPQRGAQGTKFSVFITTLYELLTSSTPSFSLMFGQKKVPASLKRLGLQQGSVCQYSVTAEVPHLPATEWQLPQVLVSLVMEAGDGDVVSKVNVGEFNYIDTSIQGSGGLEVSRKRKMSSDDDLIRNPAKRSASQQLRPKEEFTPYSAYPADGTNYSSYMQPTPMQSNQGYNVMQPYGARSISAYHSRPSRNLGYGYSNPSTPSGQNIKAQPQAGSWGPAYSNVGPSLSRSPALPSNTSRPSLSSLPSPGISANPPLIRTSTLQQTSSPAATPQGQLHYSAYPLYAKKAQLEINGDLDSMAAASWSDEEWDSKRRIVQFFRSQSSNKLTVSFSPISAEERAPHSICISCIFWEEKKECFVTSVDIIILLEKLVGYDFPTEEKNRTRRNLAGFRPITISKGKADTEEFFKVIMAFPAPKPRHIEKDIKVYRWSDLTASLNKIIGKYSASPSSALPPPLLTPVSGTGYATEGPNVGLSYAGDHHGAVSPRSITGSTSTAYSTIPPRTLSPHNQKSMTLQSGSSDLRSSVSHHPHEAWQVGQHHMQNSNPQQQFQHQHQQQQQLGNQSARASWDMPNYLESTPANSSIIPANTTQNLNFQTPNLRSVGDTAGSGPPADNNNQMGRSLSSTQQSHQMPRT